MVYWQSVAIVLGMFACCAAQSPAIQQPSHPRTKIEFRLAETAPADGLTEATTKEKGEKIYLHKEAVVSESDIRDARVVQNQSLHVFEIGVVFTNEGARKMAEATRNHIGRLMAILIDDQVVVAPRVNSIVEAECQITGQFTKEEAEAIVRGLNKK